MVNEAAGWQAQEPVSADPRYRFVAKCHPQLGCVSVSKPDIDLPDFGDVIEAGVDQKMFLGDGSGVVVARNWYLQGAFKVTWVPAVLGLVFAVAAPEFVTVWEVEDTQHIRLHLRHIIRAPSGSHVDLAFAPAPVGIKLAVATTQGPIRTYRSASSLMPTHWELVDEVDLCDATAHRLTFGMLGNHLILAVGLREPSGTNKTPRLPIKLYDYNRAYGQWQELLLGPMGFLEADMQGWNDVIVALGNSSLRNCGLFAVMPMAGGRCIPSIYEIPAGCVEGHGHVRRCYVSRQLEGEAENRISVESVTNLAWNDVGGTLAVGSDVMCLYQVQGVADPGVGAPDWHCIKAYARV
eukprot:comp12372_c0_seq1/m.7260 comp12372_c0_seq1/g.7260  ORF comp12372_c0_seq1/g.7260 comp12372_c0_seq1/m.7260 type:complete len:351 (-) comp12372_c0_seq1:483-1535(-)